MLLRENAEDMGLPRNQQGWGKFNCEKLLAGWIIIPVSYTHLDVYKRQAEPLIAVQTVQAASTAKAAKVKNGLKKEGGQYYYYVKGKKVKNTWKTVTVANKTTGKKMTYR